MDDSGRRQVKKVGVIRQLKWWLSPHRTIPQCFAAQQPYWVPSRYPFSSLALYFACLILGPFYGRVLPPSWDLALQFKFWIPWKVLTSYASSYAPHLGIPASSDLNLHEDFHPKLEILDNGECPHLMVDA